MQRVNIFPFYQLGARLSGLLVIDEDQTVKEWQNKLYSAQTWLEYILDGQIPLDVSRPAAQNFLAAIKAILEPIQEQPSLHTLFGPLAAPLAAPTDERKLTWMEAYNVRNGLRTFETVLGADLESLSTYFASRKLGYDTRILIEDASNLLPSGLQPMPEETIQEFKQVGKCVAFDIPTAAGFHTIRATEAVIRKYYEAIVGHPPERTMRNWGAYVRNLDRSGADKKITGYLDHIRENYRNPVLHPEETLTSEEAQVLLGVCTSAIIMMVNAMNKIETQKLVDAAEAAETAENSDS